MLLFQRIGVQFLPPTSVSSQAARTPAPVDLMVLASSGTCTRACPFLPHPTPMHIRAHSACNPIGFEYHMRKNIYSRPEPDAPLHQPKNVLLFHPSSFLPKCLAITALYTDSIILPSPEYRSWIHCLLRPASTSKVLLCFIALTGTEYCYLHR